MIVSDRVAVKEAIVEALADAFAAQTSAPDLSTVGAYFGDPGEQAPVEYVALGQIRGREDPDVFGPTGTTDDYEIEALIWTGAHADEVTACRRAQQILEHVRATIFRATPGSPRFGQDLNVQVFPASQDGPNGVGIEGEQAARAGVLLSIGVKCATRS